MKRLTCLNHFLLSIIVAPSCVLEVLCVLACLLLSPTSVDGVLGELALVTWAILEELHHGLHVPHATYSVSGTNAELICGHCLQNHFCFGAFFCLFLN